jgi:predicted ribosomally synthesized peptide with SipW-like signal peptide
VSRTSRPKKNRKKQYLMLLAVAGLIAVVGGGAGSGTFASFTAETTNADNYFATGTLLLHNIGTDSEGNDTALCKSETDTANNDNVGCDALFEVPASDGSSAEWAELTLTNAGSIDAAHITVDNDGTTCDVATPASITTDHLGVALTTTPDTTQLTLATGTSAALSKGDTLVVAEGGHAQTFTVDADATSGATVIDVVDVAANYAYTTAATVDTSPTFGTAPANCDGLQFLIVETDSGFSDATSESNTGADGTACSFAAANGTSCTFDSSLNLGSTFPDGSSTTPTTHDLVDSGGTDVGLAAGASRYFLIGVKPDASGGNEYQNRKFTFNLHWTITQA